MDQHNKWDTYRTSWEIFKTLLWLQLWVLKVLLIWAQLMHFTQG